MTQLRLAVIVSLTQLLLNILWAADDNRAAIGYSSGGVLRIATDSGRVLRTLEAKPRIGDFAISSDGQKVVFSPLGTEYGGPLYLLNLLTRKSEPLAEDHYYVRGEVYSDPDFSPNGNELVFAIHARANGDLVEASGPFATMDLRTKKVDVLPATTNIEGGVAFANDPTWSPDGERLLLNFESDAAVADATGRTLKRLSAMVPNNEGTWLHGLGWIGKSCVVYIVGSDQRTANRAPARVLNLQTLRVAPASELLKGASESFVGLTAFSMLVRVRAIEGALIVEGTAHPWRIPVESPSHAIVRLVHQPTNQIPSACQ